MDRNSVHFGDTKNVGCSLSCMYPPTENGHKVTSDISDRVPRSIRPMSVTP